MRNVSDELCKENQNPHHMFNNFFAKSDNIIGYVRCAYWKTKATNTHSYYLILLLFYGNNGYVNTPKFYVTCNIAYPLSILFTTII